MRFNILIIIALLCCGGCSTDTTQDDTNVTKVVEEAGKAQPSFKNINKKELVTLIEKDTTIQLVDVRTLEETSQGTIDDAITEMNLVSGQFESKIDELDKNKPVILYCASGRRSAQAAELLIEKDFDKVYNYTGGYSEWSNQ